MHYKSESQLSNKLELLAPAGSLECLHAAVAGGADADYLGLSEFNARRNAENFTLENLAEVCDWAHLRSTKVFITMNVEILPGEMPRALAMARGAYEAGADALIVQDIGLAAELARTLPEMPVHASTQMNIHNAAGIEAAWRLGATRVTLARELSVPEIAELAQVAADFGMEIETFAHGALCVCYSGQCLMSSMIGGRSANRGLCAQACRLPYELHADDSDQPLPTPGEHLLSPKDLCTVDMLGELYRAGVASLKIEGRMKSADYVYAVVSAYRAVLDRLEQAINTASVDTQSVCATEAEHAQLEEAFSRGFTTAYLTSERGNEIMSYGRPNNRGVFAGRVAAVADGLVDIACDIELHEGDVLEFWTNQGHFTYTLATLQKTGTGLVRTTPDKRVGKGDRVFRVRNAQLAFEDSPFDPRIAVNGFVRIRVGKPLELGFSLVDDPSMAVVVHGPVVEAARTKPLSRQDVVDHIDRMGQTPFVLADLNVDLDDSAGMGFSQLHHVRSDALDELTAHMLAPYRGRRASEFESIALIGQRTAQPCKVVAWATNPACARAARRAGADDVYVPVLNYRRNQAVYEGAVQQAEQAGYPKQCIMAFPTIDHDPLASTREGALDFDIWDYVREGRTVYMDSVAGCIRAQSMGLAVEAGPHVILTNAEALAQAREMGVTRSWLSPELTLGQIDELARQSSIDLGITVIGHQELMICEHCLLMSQGPCAQNCPDCTRRKKAHRLVDRKGFAFPIITDFMGRSHLYNGVELDITASIPDLIDIGVSALMVDTTFMDKKTAADAVARTLRARDVAMSGGSADKRALQKRTGTTTGHLFRGVS